MDTNNKDPLEIRIMNFQNENIEILKTKRAHNYNYAPLDVILPIIKPKLKQYGIGFYHSTGFSEVSLKNYVKTVVFNLDDLKDQIVSTTHIDEDAKIATMNKFMVMGSAMTYFRRYHLELMLGLTTDEDNDAGGANTSKPTGRSIDSNKGTTTVDYIAIFKNQLATKSKIQVEKSFNNYKSAMTEDEIKIIEQLIKETNDKK